MAGPFHCFTVAGKVRLRFAVAEGGRGLIIKGRREKVPVFNYGMNSQGFSYRVTHNRRLIIGLFKRRQ